MRAARTAPSSELRRWRTAVCTIFALTGLVFATWASRAPAVRDLLHATTQEMGFLILGMSAIGRTIMPLFHGSFSGGTVLGAAAGALLASLGVPMGVRFSAGGVIASVVTIVLVRFLQPAEQPLEDGAEPALGGWRGRLTVWRDPRVLLIGVGARCLPRVPRRDVRGRGRSAHGDRLGGCRRDDRLHRVPRRAAPHRADRAADGHPAGAARRARDDLRRGARLRRRSVADQPTRIGPRSVGLGG
jgi:hypothetical protein